MAGRLTLTRSILASIPTYAMSTFILPDSVFNSIDKMTRNFIWGGSNNKRGMHLVNRTKITKPKASGGLGIRTASDMNMALIGKLAWRFLTEHEKVWIQVLYKKYLREPGRNYANSSLIWKSIKWGVDEVVGPGSRWAVGNGDHTRFWLDKWLGDRTLASYVEDSITDEEQIASVRTYWSGSGNRG